MGTRLAITQPICLCPPLAATIHVSRFYLLYLCSVVYGSLLIMYATTSPGATRVTIYYQRYEHCFWFGLLFFRFQWTTVAKERTFNRFIYKITMIYHWMKV